MERIFRPGIEIKVLDERLKTWGLPKYQSAMAAAVDLHACLDAPFHLDAGSPAQLIPSGIAIHIANPNIVGVIAPRSGAAHKTGLVLGNLLGVIDADYTGPILISVWNRNAPGTPPIIIRPGDRIAQMMFLPVARVDFELVENFSQHSERGTGGFGSTGTAVLPAAD